MVVQLAETLPEPLVLRRPHLLVVEEDHQVFISASCNLLVAEFIAEIDAEDFGADDRRRFARLEVYPRASSDPGDVLPERDIFGIALQSILRSEVEGMHLTRLIAVSALLGRGIMTVSIKDTDVPASAGWRFKLGIAIVALALGLWLLILLAGVLGVSAARIAALTGVVFIANKVLLLACIAVMGKAGFQQLKGLIFGYAKTFAPTETVGPVRHVVGLVMFCLPLLSSMLEPYIDQLWPGLRPNIWQLQALGDLMLIASFFVLGGDFWSKIRALFIRTVRVEGVETREASAL